MDCDSSAAEMGKHNSVKKVSLIGIDWCHTLGPLRLRQLGTCFQVKHHRGTDRFDGMHRGHTQHRLRTTQRHATCPSTKQHTACVSGSDLEPLFQPNMTTLSLAVKHRSAVYPEAKARAKQSSVNSQGGCAQEHCIIPSVCFEAGQ